MLHSFGLSRPRRLSWPQFFLAKSTPYRQPIFYQHLGLDLNLDLNLDLLTSTPPQYGDPWHIKSSIDRFLVFAATNNLLTISNLLDDYCAVTLFSEWKNGWKKD